MDQDHERELEKQYRAGYSDGGFRERQRLLPVMEEMRAAIGLTLRILANKDELHICLDADCKETLGGRLRDALRAAALAPSATREEGQA